MRLRLRVFDLMAFPLRPQLRGFDFAAMAWRIRLQLGDFGFTISFCDFESESGLYALGFAASALRFFPFDFDAILGL